MIEKLRKVLKPNCSNAMTVIFRPDCVGPHNNGIIIETNHLSGRKMVRNCTDIDDAVRSDYRHSVFGECFQISLNGFGGAPKIFIRNLKSDLNGSKIIRLTNSEPENQIFGATMEFMNKGNIPGFVSVQTIMKGILIMTWNDNYLKLGCTRSETFHSLGNRSDIKRNGKVDLGEKGWKKLFRNVVPEVEQANELSAMSNRSNLA